MSWRKEVALVIQELDEKQLQEIATQNKKLQAMLQKQGAELATIQGMLSELQNEPEKLLEVSEGDNTQRVLKPLREAPEPSESHSPEVVYVETTAQEILNEEKPSEQVPERTELPEKPSEATEEFPKGKTPPREEEQPETHSEPSEKQPEEPLSQEEPQEPEPCRELECAVSDGDISKEEWSILSEQEHFTDTIIMTFGGDSMTREPYRKPDTSNMLPRVRFKLDEVLKAKGVYQTDLADKLEIRRSTLTGMKTARSINLHYLGKIMKELDITDFNEILELVTEE